MKVRSAIKRICGFCQIIRRGKILYVRCQKNNRHKQRQGFHTTNQSFVMRDPKFCECPSGMVEINSMDLKFPKTHNCENKANKKDSLDIILDSINNKLI